MTPTERDETAGIHPALGRGHAGVVTGAAFGIGLAVVSRLAALGMRVAMVDLPSSGLEDARETLVREGADPDALAAMPTDVTNEDAVLRLPARVRDELGTVQALFANAGIQPGSSIFDEEGTWDRILETNLMGIVRIVQAFAPDMIHGGERGLVVTTGSMQGITSPPGDPAYNVSKAGVKVYSPKRCSMTCAIAPDAG